jgi:hypothetical protein
MFARRHYRGLEAEQQEFLRQAANLLAPGPQELRSLIDQAHLETAHDTQPAEPGEGFLPLTLQLPEAEGFAGQMMRHPAPLEVDGTVRTCPECGVDRDWLVLCIGPDVWLRCRSAHEFHEPALTGTWYEKTRGHVQHVFTTKDEGLAAEGFDGTFSGTVFTD